MTIIIDNLNQQFEDLSEKLQKIAILRAEACMGEKSNFSFYLPKNLVSSLENLKNVSTQIRLSKSELVAMALHSYLKNKSKIS